MPRVSVVMSVHNGEPFLPEALESVLTQTLADFEFIIVDDASDDRTPEILARVAAADRRIRIIRNPQNLGLTKSLNVGLSGAVGKYIARIDADDICLPTRLSKQLAFMERNPDHVAIGCGYHVINEQGDTIRIVNNELDDWQIRWVNGFYPPTAHPTYFFRRQRSDGKAHLYDEAYIIAEDFEFWSRLARYGNLRVLPDVLVKYRRHPGANTELKRREQVIYSSRTAMANLEQRLPPEIVERLGPLVALFAYEAPADSRTILNAVSGCDAMLAHDLRTAPTPRHRRWLRRTAASLLADAILSRAGGIKSLSSTAAFLYHARRYLPALAFSIMSQPRLALKSLRNAGRF